MNNTELEPGWLRKSMDENTASIEMKAMIHLAETSNNASIKDALNEFRIAVKLVHGDELETLMRQYGRDWM